MWKLLVLRNLVLGNSLNIICMASRDPPVRESKSAVHVRSADGGIHDVVQRQQNVIYQPQQANQEWRRQAWQSRHDGAKDQAAHTDLPLRFAHNSPMERQNAGNVYPTICGPVQQRPEELLLENIWRGHDQKVRELLTKHTHMLNQFLSTGRSPLNEAIRTRNTDIVDAILKFRPRVSEYSLPYAVNLGHIPIVQLMIRYLQPFNTKYRNPRNNPLFIACELNDINMIDLLLEKGALQASIPRDISGRESLLVVMVTSYHQPEAVECILRYCVLANILLTQLKIYYALLISVEKQQYQVAWTLLQFVDLKISQLPKVGTVADVGVLSQKSIVSIRLSEGDEEYIRRVYALALTYSQKTWLYRSNHLQYRIKVDEAVENLRKSFESAKGDDFFRVSRGMLYNPYVKTDDVVGDESTAAVATRQADTTAFAPQRNPQGEEQNQEPSARDDTQDYEALGHGNTQSQEPSVRDKTQDREVLGHGNTQSKEPSAGDGNMQRQRQPAQANTQNQEPAASANDDAKRLNVEASELIPGGSSSIARKPQTNFLTQLGASNTNQHSYLPQAGSQTSRAMQAQYARHNPHRQPTPHVPLQWHNTDAQPPSRDLRLS